PCARGQEFFLRWSIRTTLVQVDHHLAPGESMRLHSCGCRPYPMQAAIRREGGTMSLEKRIALVSGGSRGSGRAIALGLAADGADVAINYRRDEEAARATVAEIEKLGRRAQAYAADVGEYDQCVAMVERAEADFGRFDILVCNAGIASRGSTV